VCDSFISSKKWSNAIAKVVVIKTKTDLIIQCIEKKDVKTRTITNQINDIYELLCDIYPELKSGIWLTYDETPLTLGLMPYSMQQVFFDENSYPSWSNLYTWDKLSKELNIDLSILKKNIE
jgi:hypothetical protein